VAAAVTATPSSFSLAPDDVAKFADAGSLLPELNKRHAFFQMRRSELEALGIVGEDAVVFGDGLLVIFLGVSNFAEIELRVGGEVGVAVELEVVLEFLAGEIVIAAGDVAESVGVESIGRGCGTAWCSAGG
jgi:hypothetical protein